MVNIKVVIRKGKGVRSEYLYATVYDADTNEILIAADAQYVTNAIKERKHNIVSLEVEE